MKHCKYIKAVTTSLLLLFTINLKAQNNWVSKASIIGSVKYGYVSFVIGKKIYVATGSSINSGTIGSKELYEYDDSTDVWTRKADFPGSPRNGAFGFSIKGKGYIGTGRDGQSSYANDFWEYDPVQNKWTKKADFPGGKRTGGFGLSIGERGFAGGGVSLSTTSNPLDGNFNNDMYEYIPTSDSWVTRASFGSVGRRDVTKFSIGLNGYIGLGTLYSQSSCSNCNRTNDFFEYNSELNTWRKIANYPDSTTEAFGFSIDKSGFVGGGSNGLGYTKNFYEYIPSINKWRIRANVIVERGNALGENTLNNGFMLGGNNISNNQVSPNNDVYKFTPCSGYINSNITEYICDGSTYNFNGRVLNKEGIYFDTLYSKNGCDSAIILNLKLIKNPIINVKSLGDTIFCPGDSTKIILVQSRIDTLQYQWLFNNSVLSTSSDTFIIAKNQGLYQLKGVNKKYGCSTISTPIKITHNSIPPPPSTADIFLCKDSSSKQLTANVLSGHILKWYGTNISGGTSTSTPPTPSTSSAGTTDYFVSQVNEKTKCESSRAKLSVTVNNLSSKPTISRNSTNELFSSSGTGNQWYLNDLIITGATSPILKPTQQGYYTVKVTNLGCQNTVESSKYYFVLSNIANEYQIGILKIIPNPSYGHIMLKSNINEIGIVQVSIYSLGGNLIKNLKQININQIIDLRGISRGSYFFVVKDKSGKILHKQVQIIN